MPSHPLVALARALVTERGRFSLALKKAVKLARQGGLRDKLEEKLFLGSGPPGPLQYRAWLRQHCRLSRADRARIAQRVAAMAAGPRFGIAPSGAPSERTLRSLAAQLYPRWSLAPDAAATHLVLLPAGAVLTPDALYELAEALASPGPAVAYADEDVLDARGRRRDPWFKTAWDPDLFLAQDFVTGGLVAIDVRLLRDRAREPGAAAGALSPTVDPLPPRPLAPALLGPTVPLPPALDGAARYDLVLRCAAAGARMVHVPRVLSSAPPRAAHADRLPALRAHWPEATFAPGLAPGTVHVRPPLLRTPLVSIIVPTRDGGEVLARCLRGVREGTSYPSIELLVVDNQSRAPGTLALLREHEQRGARVLRFDHPFNYSAINNFAAREARGELFCLLNDDIEIVDPGWLDELVAHAVRPDIGAVGAMLRYPDGHIQHAGVGVGLLGLAGHFHKGLPGDADGYRLRAKVAQNVSAVTAACLVVRREAWERAGGLDEGLQVAFNDVDFCLRLRQLGLRNLWTPHAALVHHESRTRGRDDTDEKRRRNEREVAFFRARWGDPLPEDPAYNPNLSLHTETFGLAWPPRSRARRTGA